MKDSVILKFLAQKFGGRYELAALCVCPCGRHNPKLCAAGHPKRHRHIKRVKP